MKKLSILILLVATVAITSCGGGGGGGDISSYKGQLMGSGGRAKWRAETPYGMVTVPSGSLTLGQGDQDVVFSITTKTKQVSIHGFYMDATEITNNEYRQFVDYVRDSISHTILNHFVESNGDEGAGDKPKIDWRKKIDSKDQEAQSQLASLYLSSDQQINGKKEIDISKLVYRYDALDYQKASRFKYSRDKNKKNLLDEKIIPVYPDTMVWVRDFTYSYNEPFTRQYFNHPAFDDYPVVGVTWDQANAFAFWRTEFLNNYRNSKGKMDIDVIRLPNEGEWEFAARGGKKGSPYPWGGPYTRNQKGCILANFKPTRGNYLDDGGFYTVRVDSYFPNDYGLYNMSGNVAEWTESHFAENSYSFSHDLNPNISYNHSRLDNETMKRKVIRGGSWKDVAYLIQNQARTFEYADSAKSYVGFRCVSTTLK